MTDATNHTQSPFLIGITGHMDLIPSEVEGLRQRLDCLFRFVKFGTTRRKGEPREEPRRRLRELIELLVPKDADQETRQTYQRVLGGWKGLPNTPIIVQTGLAPGADSLVADVALQHRFQVRGVLPFDRDLYADASTFVRAEPDASGQRRLSSSDLARQKEFHRLCDKMKPEDLYAVRLIRDLTFVEEERKKLTLEERRTLTPEEINDLMSVKLRALTQSERDDRTDKKSRHQRYYAAGEHLAVSSHLLLAIWDGVEDQPPSDSKSIACGTSAIVQARLEGPSPDMLPTSQGLTLPHGGPLLILFARQEKFASRELPDVPLQFRHPFPPKLLKPAPPPT